MYKVFTTLVLIAVLVRLADRPATVASVYSSQVNSVVRVEPYSSPVINLLGFHIQLPWSNHWGHGTGVILTSKGHILTAGHVGKVSGIFLITTQSGLTYKAGVLAIDPLSDLAILQPLERIPESLDPVTLGVTTQIGESVVCVGNPIHFDSIVTAGIVSGLQSGYVISDTVVNPGSSGGPLFNMAGKLIGITSGMEGIMPFPMFQGHSMFVPIRDIVLFVKKYKEMTR